MPPNTSPGPRVAGGSFRIGGRKLAARNCQDEVVAALVALQRHTDAHVFTIREVYAEMTAARTRYAETTVFKTMQRMKVPSNRPPYLCRVRVGRQGYRLEPAEPRSPAERANDAVGGPV